MKNHDPKKIVRFVFSTFEKTSADLKLRLRYDNLSQVKFFAGIVKLYLENDPDMIRVLYKVKSQAQVMGKKKLKRSVEDIGEGLDIMESLGITKKDKENIFDMIEMDLKEDE
jgi:hypothetical protein